MNVRAIAVSTCLGVALCAVSAPALAQAKKATPTAGSASDMNLAAMYSYEHNYGVNSPFGVAVDFSKKMSQISPTMNVQVLGQFVFSHYHFGGSDTMFAGGVRFGMAPHGNVTPYFQAIVGGTHCCGNGLWLTTVFGGGVDVSFTGMKSMKLRIEGNFVTIFDDPENGFRLNVGVVIPIGKK